MKLTKSYLIPTMLQDTHNPCCSFNWEWSSFFHRFRRYYQRFCSHEGKGCSFLNFWPVSYMRIDVTKWKKFETRVIFWNTECARGGYCNHSPRTPKT
jgi:hypothetical protein